MDNHYGASRKNEPSYLGFTISPGSLAFGLLFLSVGFLLLYQTGQVSVLLCSRGQDGRVDCQVQRRLFGLIPVGPSSPPIQNVLNAQVGEDCAPECRYLFTLQTAGGPVPLVAFESTIARYPRTLAFELNNFLERRKNSTFTGREPIRPGIWPPILILSTGVVILAFGLSTSTQPGTEPSRGEN